MKGGFNQAIYILFFLTGIIASSLGECELALCTAGRSSSGLTHVNKMFL